MSKNIEQLTTYAQNREDLYLYALLCDLKKGFYVDVGANHERLHSVTKLFYKIGWKGINIEPNSKLIKEFKLKRKRDINLQTAVSDKSGTLSFREYPNHDGLSTLSKEIKSLNSKKNIPYTDYNIKVEPLKKIFEKNNVSRIDFLKVDVEGLELEVLKSNSWVKYRPRIVTFEGTSREACIEFMQDKGYRVEFFDGLNYYMIDKKDTKSSIHNFAGSVLTKGIYTDREETLMESSECPVCAKEASSPGVKQSLANLARSLKSKIAS